jgi:hypothetical protein
MTVNIQRNYTHNTIISNTNILSVTIQFESVERNYSFRSVWHTQLPSATNIHQSSARSCTSRSPLRPLRSFTATLYMRIMRRMHSISLSESALLEKSFTKLVVIFRYHREFNVYRLLTYIGSCEHSAKKIRRCIINLWYIRNHRGHYHGQAECLDRLDSHYVNYVRIP